MHTMLMQQSDIEICIQTCVSNFEAPFNLKFMTGIASIGERERLAVLDENDNKLERGSPSATATTTTKKTSSSTSI